MLKRKSIEEDGDATGDVVTEKRLRFTTKSIQERILRDHDSGTVDRLLTPDDMVLFGAEQDKLAEGECRKEDA